LFPGGDQFGYDGFEFVGWDVLTHYLFLGNGSVQIKFGSGVATQLFELILMARFRGLEGVLIVFFQLRGYDH